MEIDADRLVFALVLGILPVAGAANDQACFSGGHDSGSLSFAAAVEGTGFAGRFERFSVRYCMEESGPAAGRIEVEVELASAGSGNRDRDQTMRGAEFFDIENHPVARWESRRIDPDGDGYVAQGRLTLKGVTAEQSIRFSLDRSGSEWIASGSLVLAGDAEVDRQRFGVGTGEFADPEFVRNRVGVEFSVELSSP